MIMRILHSRGHLPKKSGREKKIDHPIQNIRWDRDWDSSAGTEAENEVQR